MSRLVVESGVDGGMIFPLSTTTVTMGRSVSNSIQIIDRKVSRKHAEIYFKDGDYYFHDMGSKNGSFINGKQVKKDTLLEDGFRVKVGETVLIYESDQDESSSLSDATSRSVKIVDNLEWGKPRRSVAAGTGPELDLGGGEGKEPSFKDTHKRLAILYQVADVIRNILNLDELLDQIMNIIYEVIKPDRGFIMIKDMATGKFVPRAIRRRDVDDGEITISSTIVEQCLRERVSILVSDAAADQRFSSSESVIINRIRSAICAPLIYKQEILGVIYIDTQKRRMSYDEEELELVNGIANQSAMAIANARMHVRLVEQHKSAKEMEIARNIQMNLLPKVFPVLDKVDISAMSLPAKKVGGDYYDFIPLDKGRYGVVIADVSGKGVPAAILLATIRASLLIEARQDNATVTSVISRINRMACRDATNNMYVTMVYGILEPKKMTFEYVNAGHTYPLLFETPSKVRQLKTGGYFLGIMENADYESETIKLKSGQTLLIYSDGVTDTMNMKGELFGEERLRKHLSSHIHQDAHQLRDSVHEECVKFRGEAEQFDDFTLVILKGN